MPADLVISSAAIAALLLLALFVGLHLGYRWGKQDRDSN